MQDVHPKGADPPPKSVIKPFTYEETLVAFRWLDRLAEGPVPQSGTIPYVMATNLWARGEIAPHTVIRRDDKGVVIERIPHWRLHDMNITCCQRPNGHPPGAQFTDSCTEAIFPGNSRAYPYLTLVGSEGSGTQRLLNTPCRNSDGTFATLPSTKTRWLGNWLPSSVPETKGKPLATFIWP